MKVEVKATVPIKAPYTAIKVFKETRDKLKVLKKDIGFASYNGLFNYLALEHARENFTAPATFEAIFEETSTIPAFVTGQSGSFKTTTVKAILKRWPGSVFVMDVGNEYSDYRRVDLGKFFSIDWEKESLRVRFVPNEKVEVSKTEASLIFSHLNMVRQSGALKSWVLCIEEAHRFQDDPNLRTLLNEARKFTRKLIVVTPDIEAFKGIAKVFKPTSRPLEITS